jgi:formamidopyrimidine-DNA glycosylase
MRKFGRAYYFSTSRELQFYLSKRVGKEPFLITDGEFVDIFRKRKGIIKGALLRQDLVCGLGNIYVDESLFKAGIFPTEVCNTISKNKLIELSRAIKEVLKNAINLRGTSMRDYLDITGSAGKYKDILNVYGREGKPCKKCGMKIEKIKVASRGTHVCYECQGRKNRESRF